MKYLSLVLRFFIAIPFAASLIYFYSLNSEGMQKQNRTADFVPVEATVIESRVQQIKTRKRFYYEPRIVYEYIVAGERHTSDRLGFGGAKPEVANAEDGPQKYVLEYPEGSVIEAFYNPENPAEAVLTREQITGSPVRYFIIGLGIFFALIIFGPWVLKYLR